MPLHVLWNSPLQFRDWDDRFSSPVILAPSCWCHSTIYRKALALLLGLGLGLEGCGLYKVMHLATSPGGPPSGTKPSVCVTLGLDTWVPGLVSAIFL